MRQQAPSSLTPQGQTRLKPQERNAKKRILPVHIFHLIPAGPTHIRAMLREEPSAILSSARKNTPLTLTNSPDQLSAYEGNVI